MMLLIYWSIMKTCHIISIFILYILYYFTQYLHLVNWESLFITATAFVFHIMCRSIAYCHTKNASVLQIMYQHLCGEQDTDSDFMCFFGIYIVAISAASGNDGVTGAVSIDDAAVDMVSCHGQHLQMPVFQSAQLQCTRQRCSTNLRVCCAVGQQQHLKN
jgi:hypothetical protein